MSTRPERQGLFSIETSMLSPPFVVCELRFFKNKKNLKKKKSPKHQKAGPSSAWYSSLHHARLPARLDPSCVSSKSGIVSTAVANGDSLARTRDRGIVCPAPAPAFLLSSVPRYLLGTFLRTRMASRPFPTRTAEGRARRGTGAQYMSPMK